MAGGAGNFAERLKKRNVKKELRKIQRIENNALEKILKIKKTENSGSPRPGHPRMGAVKLDDKDTTVRKAKKALWKTFALSMGVKAPLMKNANVISKDNITAHKRPKFKTLSPSRFQRFMPSIHDFAHPGRHNEAKPRVGPKRPDYLEAILIRREIQEKRKSKDRMQQKIAMFQKYLDEARLKYRKRRDSTNLAQKNKKMDMDSYLRPLTQMLADNNIGLSLMMNDQDHSLTKGLFEMIRKEMAGSSTVTDLAMGLGIVAESIQDFDQSNFARVSQFDACQPRLKPQTDIRARFFSRGKSPLNLGKTGGEEIRKGESFRLKD
jgi:hypothetical protein